MKLNRWFALGLVLLSFLAQAQTELRLAVHQSFSLPKELLAEFERTNDVKLKIIKVGGGSEMLNKLILTRANPIADVVYGLDNTNVIKARQFDILASHQPESRAVTMSLPQIVAIDYGYVTINYDKAWFARHRLPLPSSLDELTHSRYKDLLVVPNPTTSVVGLNFLMANIGALGEQATWTWWERMRQNGIKITRSWSDAYYTEFTLNGGSRPMVVSYASSPAAELFYSKGKYQKAPSGNLLLNGGIFLQTEGAAVLNRTPQPQLAAKLVQFLQSNQVQTAIPTQMWMYPAVKDIAVPEVMKQMQVNINPKQPDAKEILINQQRWIRQWIKTVLR